MQGLGLRAAPVARSVPVRVIEQRQASWPAARILVLESGRGGRRLGQVTEKSGYDTVIARGAAAAEAVLHANDGRGVQIVLDPLGTSASSWTREHRGRRQNRAVRQRSGRNARAIASGRPADRLIG